jgi:transposase
LRNDFEKRPDEFGYDYGRWTSPIIRDHIYKKTGISYSKSRICELMKEWDFTVQRPRMQSVKSDAQEQQAFVELFSQLTLFLAFLAICGFDVKILFTDEASFRRDGTIRSGWYKKGSKPIIPESNGRFESVKLIGAVDSQEGSFHLRQAGSKITLEVYADFLAYLSSQYEDKLLVIVHDNAPWHGSKSLSQHLADRGVFNIIIVRLPKYSPDMNPCEKLWNWMRETVTHCKYYESLRELKDAIWRFYRRAYNQREKAKKRFKTEKPLIDINVKLFRKEFAKFFCFLYIAVKLNQ